MIDTVKIRSVPLPESVAAICELGMTLKTAVDCSTGEQLYSLTSESLVGTYDARISARLFRDEIVVVGSAVLNGGRRPVTALRTCDPYLVLECSVHKQLQGHNITGGPSSLLPAVRWLVDHVGRLLGVALPDGGGWLLERVDVTECYQMEYAAIQEYIGSLNYATYPRRKVFRYGSEAIFAPGTSSSVKIYHKGPEFSKHDRPRLAQQLDRGAVYDLQQLANGIMRCEVGLHTERLKRDFGAKPIVSAVSDEYLMRAHDIEVARLLREGRSEMQTVRDTQAVSRRLYDLHSGQLAGVLFSTWVRLATLGETEARRGMTKPTWYRHRKMLEDAGCAWAGSDIRIEHTSIPVGFTVRRSDSRRDCGESAVVEAALAPYRLAV